MPIGVVKWFDKKKGFGFIRFEEVDYFAHFREIMGGPGFKELLDGQKVEFSPKKGEKGMMAQNIKVVD